MAGIIFLRFELFKVIFTSRYGTNYTCNIEQTIVYAIMLPCTAAVKHFPFAKLQDNQLHCNCNTESESANFSN